MPSESNMLYSLLKAFALPPGIFVLTGALCAALFWRHNRAAWVILCSATLMLYALSTLLVGKQAIALLEPAHALDPQEINRFMPQAIVVVGADRIGDAPEYDDDDQPGANLLLRLRYAARLHRQTGLPILVSGGPGAGGQLAQSAIMAQVLQEDFQVPVRWRENRSLTTWENAAYSREILLREGIDRVLLVTQAFHMHRANESFAHVGIRALPAPTYFMGRLDTPLQAQDFYPGTSGLQLSTFALHEYLGLLYYRLRYFGKSANTASVANRAS
jgi:uncharacterized SAM-binding protein YcdF (DUF218 family)